MGIIYVTGDRIRFVAASIVMVLGKTQVSEVGDRGIGDCKSEEFFVGGIM